MSGDIYCCRGQGRYQPFLGASVPLSDARVERVCLTVVYIEDCMYEYIFYTLLISFGLLLLVALLSLTDQPSGSAASVFLPQASTQQTPEPTSNSHHAALLCCVSV